MSLEVISLSDRNFPVYLLCGEGSVEIYLKIQKRQKEKSFVNDME
jgi:hypothetical protein